MLAGQIAHLAGLGMGVITRWDLASHVRVKMGPGRGAVAVRWHWHGVDMVHYESSSQHGLSTAYNRRP